MTKKKTKKKAAKKKASKKKTTKKKTSRARARQPDTVLEGEVIQKNIGRPRVLSSPEELLLKAEEYFEECRVKMEANPLNQHMSRPVLMGLILHLGLSSRESLDEYGRREEFSDSVAYVKARIEMYYELMLGSSSTSSGAAFALKNFGWKDRTEVTTPESPTKQLSTLEKATRIAAILRQVSTAEPSST